MVFLDLDELEVLDRRLRLFSLERWNLFSFRPRDHGDGTAVPLREQIVRQLQQAGMATEGLQVRLLTMPRLLGFVFNPNINLKASGSATRLSVLAFCCIGQGAFGSISALASFGEERVIALRERLLVSEVLVNVRSSLFSVRRAAEKCSRFCS